MNYSEIRTAEQSKINQLLTDCLIFFAFSNEQFAQNKTSLQEGEKYISIGAGGYMPKLQYQNFSEGMKGINSWKKAEMKKEKQIKIDAIKYELANYECFLTHDLTDVFRLFPADKKQVVKIFNEELTKNY